MFSGSFIATANQGSQALREARPWLIVLVVAVFVGGVAIMVARRYMRGADNATARGYTLHDLRQMNASGELSDEEFQRARDSMIAGVRSAIVRESTNDAGPAQAEISDGDPPGSDEHPEV